MKRWKVSIVLFYSHKQPKLFILRLLLCGCTPHKCLHACRGAYVWMHASQVLAHMLWYKCVEVREQRVEITVLHSPCGFWGPNMGHHVWWHGLCP